jgi:hypothetical protein
MSRCQKFGIVEGKEIFFRTIEDKKKKGGIRVPGV